MFYSAEPNGGLGLWGSQIDAGKANPAGTGEKEFPPLNSGLVATGRIG